MRKQNTVKLTKEKLNDMEKQYHAKGYGTPKWIKFCLTMLDRKYIVRYYDAVSTVSKYIYVFNPTTKIEVKVRFSNHKPNPNQEFKNDSDYYVGISNGGVITTEHIIPKIILHLEQREQK
jgi:hypothetical protein